MIIRACSTSSVAYFCTTGMLWHNYYTHIYTPYNFISSMDSTKKKQITEKYTCLPTNAHRIHILHDQYSRFFSTCPTEFRLNISWVRLVCTTLSTITKKKKKYICNRLLLYLFGQPKRQIRVSEPP